MEDERSVTWGILNLTDDERQELISGVLSNIDLSKARRALEHAAKSKLVTDFVQFITNFSLEKALRGLILRAAEEGLQLYGQDRHKVELLAQQRDEFLSCFDTITSWSDNPEHRQVALTAVLSTFAIALHGHAQEDLIRELRRDFTKAANKARRAEGIDEIIERHARNLWAKQHSFKNNNLGTATKIHKDVVTSISELISVDPNKVPQKWRPVKSPDADSTKREINRIAKRVGKIVR